MRPYYVRDGVTLYHGDCREVLCDLGSTIDVLLTDPPYGINYVGDGKTTSVAIHGDSPRQALRLLRQMFGEAARHMAPDAHALVFCNWQTCSDFQDVCGTYATLRNLLFWEKERGSKGNLKMEYIRDVELVIYGTIGRRPLNGGRQSCVLRGHPAVPSRKRTHPTEKPVSLNRYLIQRHAPAGGQGLIVDPFVGSGSTLIAARELGYRAVGVELREQHCEDAAKRLEAAA